MKLIRSFTGAALATAALAVAAQAQAQITTLQIESAIPAAHATSKSMEIFKDEVVRLSDGSMAVEVMPGSKRPLRDLIDDVHVGHIFATWMSVGIFSKLVPEIAAISLPFVFDNYDQAKRSVAGPVGTLITRKLEAKGFIILAWMDLGTLQVSNSKRPLKTLDDFKGLTIRVLPTTTHLAAFKAIGARPVVMDFTDVATALRQGDIDGQELDYSTIYANKFYEIQKYLSDTGQFLDFHVLVADKKTFASLDPMQQKAVREAAAIAAVRQHQISTEDQATALARLRDAGMQFDPLTSKMRAALRRATASVIDDTRKGVGADVVNKVLAVKMTPAAGRAVVSDKVSTGKGSHQ
jgi:tripartite ATP-independent transporter DctP family solute receptor